MSTADTGVAIGPVRFVGGVCEIPVDTKRATGSLAWLERAATELAEAWAAVPVGIRDRMAPVVIVLDRAEVRVEEGKG